MSALQLRNACDEFIRGALRSYATLAHVRSAEPYRDGTRTYSLNAVDVRINNFTGIGGTRIQVIILENGVPVIDIPRITESAVWYQLVDAYTIRDIAELLETVELVIRIHHPLK